MMNPYTRFPLFFPQLQSYLLGFYSIACMLATCGTRIFNRYTAILASVLYIVDFFPNYFSPNFTYVHDFSHYYGQHLAFFGSLAFLMTTIVRNGHEPSIFYYLLVAMTAAFACSVNFQLLLVILPALLIYLFCRISNEKKRWHKVPWVLPITSILIMFWYMSSIGKQVYPNILFGAQSTTLQFKIFGNFEKLYGPAGGNIERVFLFLFNAGYGIAILGLLWPLFPRPSIFRLFFNSGYGAAIFPLLRLRLKNVKCQFSHFFLWSGILTSLFAGTFIYYEAGGSGIYLYNFSIFFLFFYGADVVSSRKGIALVSAWLVIIGVCIFPEHSRYNHPSLSGRVNIDLYQSVKILPSLLPDTAKVLWVGESPDEINNRHYCSWMVNRKCSYTKNLARDIVAFKASHFILKREINDNDLPDNFDVRLIKILEVDGIRKYSLHLYAVKDTNLEII